MHYIFILTVLSLCNIAFCEWQEEDGVLLLGNANIEAALQDFKYLFINFYAPWSPSCQALEPEFNKVAKKLLVEKSPIRLAKVDATVEKDVADKFNIKGYPQMKFVGRGRPMEYVGIRDYPTMLRWLRKKVGPVAKKLNSIEDVKKFIDKNEISVIGFFKSNTSAEAKAYLSAALETDDASFAITYSPEIFKEYDVTKEGLILLKKFDEGRDDMYENLDIDNIKEFVFNNSMPKVIDFDVDNSARIFGGKVKDHLLLFMSKKSSDFQANKEVFGTMAARYKGRVQFVAINVDEKSNDALIEFFQIKKESCPEMRFVKLNDDFKRYIPNVDEVSPYAIRVFVDGILNGTIRPYLRTADIPEDWQESPLKVLVGKNFHAVTSDKKKSVFVEFYATWSDHCKTFAPIWDDLADKYKDDDDIIIAKFDVDDNEVEGLKIEGLPTLKYFPKDSDKVIDYVGERTLDGLVRFLESGGVEGGIILNSEEADQSKQKDEL